jgi:hypothetical protein
MTQLNQGRPGLEEYDAGKSKPRQIGAIWIVLALILSFMVGLLVGFFGYAYCSSTQTHAPPAPTRVCSTTSGMGEAVHLPKQTETPFEIQEPTRPPQELKPTSAATLEPTFTPEPTPTPLPPFFTGPITYGFSYNNRPLKAYRLGYGESSRAIIGGIHGGYEWNTVELVSDTLSYFRDNQHEIPQDVTLYIVPCANPDGLAAGTDAIVGRMNGNGVDLNRNWAYHHQMTATHGTRPVKAGEYPFSEPETAYLRDFILDREIELAIFYHSAMGVIFSGAERAKCATYELAEALAPITGYRHQTEGIPGQITTGDAIDWLSSVGIAAVEIELTTHQRVDEAEWQRNLDGIRAFLKWPIPGTAEEIPEEQVDEQGWKYERYTIRTGDELLQIALAHDISLEALMRANGINDPGATIYPGQVLTIPVPTE